MFFIISTQGILSRSGFPAKTSGDIRFSEEGGTTEGRAKDKSLIVNGQLCRPAVGETLPSTSVFLILSIALK